MKYKAVCFDIDGTLYPPQLLRQYMIDLAFAHPFWTIRYGKMRAAFRELQGSFEEMGLAAFPFREREAMVYIKTRPLGNLKLVDARNKLDSCYYRHLEDIYETLGKQPATARTLEMLRNRGVVTAVLSDWPLWDKLERMGLEDLFDLKYSSDDIGYLKPDIHCFSFLLEKLGLEAKDVLFVGDSYEKDIAGASGAGIDAVLVGESKEEGKYPLALEVFGNWEEFDVWITGQTEA